MTNQVLALRELDRTCVSLAGGKAANLGELSRIEGVLVPDGVCVTTADFERVLATAEVRAVLEDGDPARIRAAIEAAPLTDELAAALASLGEGPWAVRSSATTEDLAEASAAGQQESWLNVRGGDLPRFVRRCQASLFTERAVAYRARQGGGPGQMAVLVQRMVPAEVAGVLFTADPMSGNRRVTTIEAVFGLADGLVAGRTAGELYRVRDGRVLDRPADGRTLAEDDLVELERLGRRIEAHFGAPQDVEWCRVGGAFHVVQARPITGLFPVPDGGGEGFRVYFSVGHQQMMTDALRPLGRSLFQKTAGRPMFPAGGRLFVDPTAQILSPQVRGPFLAMLARQDPLTADALDELFARGELGGPAPAAPMPAPPPGAPPPDLPGLVRQLVVEGEAAVRDAEARLAEVSGVERIDRLIEDVDRLRRWLVDPRNTAVIFAAVGASTWLDETLAAWLGDVGAADVLSLSAEGNVTAEMGLALLDVADVLRPHAEVRAWLEEVATQRAQRELSNVSGEDRNSLPSADRVEAPGESAASHDASTFLSQLRALPGGAEVHLVLTRFLARYGMRCPGEIDVTRPRWSERPWTLVPLILAHVEAWPAGEAGRRFAAGKERAGSYAASVGERLRAVPGGAEKAAEAEAMIRRLRDTVGYREYPKYHLIQRYDVYRRALRAEAEVLAAAGVLADPSDLEFLTLEEVRGLRVGERVSVAERRAEHARFERLSPPRVITSEGEVLSGAWRGGRAPEGALAGLAVSAGVVEGRARVVLDPEGATFADGDILVTRFTDPGWTPLFVAVRGLVTEIGGRTSHGAVIAREYGLPAVVGVVGATTRIRDGQRIRVHGTVGYVEVLGE